MMCTIQISEGVRAEVYAVVILESVYVLAISYVGSRV
jgi:hypothetical protein